MEEDTRHLHSLQSLDIRHLKSEKESLIKSNYAYSEQISRMEIEISDLRALLQATQNENQQLSKTISKLQEDLSKSTSNSSDLLKLYSDLTPNTPKQNSNLKEDEEIQDLYEEVTELREENQFFKGEYIPKLENQLENARLLIHELENEVDCLNRENESLKQCLLENPSLNESRSSLNQREYSKPVPITVSKPQKLLKSKQKPGNYVPSIKRFEKPTKPVEYTIQLSKH